MRCRTGPPGKLISTADELYTRALPLFERELKQGAGGEYGYNVRRPLAASEAPSAACLPSEPPLAPSLQVWRPLALRSIGVRMTRLVREEGWGSFRCHDHVLNRSTLDVYHTTPCSARCADQRLECCLSNEWACIHCGWVRSR